MSPPVEAAGAAGAGVDELQPGRQAAARKRSEAAATLFHAGGPERIDLAITAHLGQKKALHYEVKFGSIKVGSGSMEVRGIDSIRGRDVYHTVFRVKGGTLFFKVDDTFESWFATDDLSSLRFHKDQNEGFK